MHWIHNMQTEEELLVTDVYDADLNGKDMGEDGLQLFIVAPARITGHNEYNNDLKDDPCFADTDRSMTYAKITCKQTKRDVCVYKLVTVARFNYKGING